MSGQIVGRNICRISKISNYKRHGLFNKKNSLNQNILFNAMFPQPIALYETFSSYLFIDWQSNGQGAEKFLSYCSLFKKLFGQFLGSRPDQNLFSTPSYSLQ